MCEYYFHCTEISQIDPKLPVVSSLKLMSSSAVHAELHT